MNLKTIVVVWGATLLIAAGQPVLRYDELPDQVASSFNAAGAPRDYSERQTFVVLFSCIPAVLNFLPMLMLGVALQLAPSFVNLPNRGYWTATSERMDMARHLFYRGWMGVCMAINVFLAALFDLIVRINTTGAGGENILYYVIALFVAVLVAVLYMVHLFRIPEQTEIVRQTASWRR